MTRLKILSLAAILSTLLGCSSVKSTHEHYNISVNCVGEIKLNNLGYPANVKVKLVRKLQNRFGVISYQARSNLQIRFAGWGLIKESNLKNITCE